MAWLRCTVTLGSSYALDSPLLLVLWLASQAEEASFVASMARQKRCGTGSERRRQKGTAQQRIDGTRAAVGAVHMADRSVPDRPSAGAYLFFLKVEEVYRRQNRIF